MVCLKLYFENVSRCLQRKEMKNYLFRKKRKKKEEQKVGPPLTTEVPVCNFLNEIWKLEGKIEQVSLKTSFHSFTQFFSSYILIFRFLTHANNNKQR